MRQRIQGMSQPNPVKNRLSGEVNIETIQALEEQIRKHERTVIELKRTRNSLLNVSKLPPEVLGDIFRWNVTLKEAFDGLEKKSRNFLFVCHHWFEVASATPEVWSFWGNTPKDWARWHRHPGTSPLDLVLGGIDHDDGTFNITLRDALQDRAERDAIRRVHLWSGDAAFLASIISPLAATGQGVRSNGMESFILTNDDDTPVDVSKFFAHYRFPKLQRLALDSCSIASWDLLTSRTTVLTSLALSFKKPSPTPTTSQLLSILASNPSLRRVSLSRHAVPEDGGGEPSYRVSLHHLRDLELAGGLRHVIGLLHRLDYPANVDLAITLRDHTVADIARIVGPYLRDYLRCRGRSRNGLGLSVSRFGHRTTLHVADVGRMDLSTPVWVQISSFVMITMELEPTPQAQGLSEKWFLDLIAHFPRDEIVSFRSWDQPTTIQDVSAQFPNLRAIHSGSMPLPAAFPESNLDGDEVLLPSLQHVFLERPVVYGGDWSPLVAFLACRASSGNRLESLTVTDSHMCPRMEEHVRTMVQEFRSNRPRQMCPFGTCIRTDLVPGV